MQMDELKTALSSAIGELVDLKDTEPSKLEYSFEPGSIIVTVSPRKARKSLGKSN